MSRSSQVIIELFKSRKVVVIDAIQAALGNASRATTFRYLNQIPYRRSYNRNGRYYTLHDPSRYDRYGLWSHRDILFSCDGALNCTVNRLVQESEAGFTHRELQQLLMVRVQVPLLQAVRQRQIERISIDELYVYVHANMAVQKQQLQRRQDGIESEQMASEKILSDAVIIQVLLTLVRYPTAQPREVARRLRGHSPPIRFEQVMAVFTRYKLGEKGGRYRR